MGFMSRWYAIFAVLAVVIAAGYVLTDSDDSEAVDPEYTFVFKLVDDATIPGPGNITSATITITDSADNIAKSTFTAPNIYTVKGIKDISDDLIVEISCPGYTIKQDIEGLTPSTDVTDETDLFIIDKDDLGTAKITYNSTTETYTLVANVVLSKTFFSLYVMDSETGLPVPSGTVVSIEDSHKNTLSSSTDAKGFVSVGIGSQKGSFTMTVDLNGYTAVPGIDFMTVKSDGSITFALKGTIKYQENVASTTYEILPGTPALNADGSKTYTYALAENKPLKMSSSSGTLTIKATMSNGTTGIVDANVTVINAITGVEVTENTNSNGIVVFSLPSGKYYFVIDVGGFEHYDSREDKTLENDGYIDVRMGSQTATPIMTEKTSATFFGMNMGHTLMLIGVVIGLILALLSYMLYTRRFRSELSEEGL
ncbi:hypothetical protein TALC_01552 [Thermoplasmatales archaeon BRNA1]|nr:hypothetical protein TALC_01552 [Thermoplasmatales archaeon BRNA1]